jgi:DNA-binding transcriptional ArsR family regulator
VKKMNVFKQIGKAIRVARKRTEIAKRIKSNALEALYSGLKIDLNHELYNQIYIRNGRLYAEIKLTAVEAEELLNEFAMYQAEISHELHYYALNDRQIVPVKELINE